MANLQGNNIFLKSIKFITSPGFALVLFGLLIFFLVPLSLVDEQRPFLLIPVKAVLAVLALQIGICTVQKWQILKRSTLVIHLGSIIILFGGLVSTFGFVATVNVYEGGITNTIYNWKVEEDVSLGYDLRAAQINMDLYPVGIRVGVVKNGQKGDLIETRTEDSFTIENYRVQVNRLDPIERIAHLSIYTINGEKIGTMSTDGRKRLPLNFAYDFVLVAFQDPKVKRMWVDLELFKNGELIEAGSSEVNHPLKWQGMKFFLTQIAFDDQGRPYAGIQISKDPGVPFVYMGFLVVCFGLLLSLRKFVFPTKIGA